MRQIKFRGHAISDSCGQSVDRIVHGDLIHEWNKLCILDEDDGDIYKVDPESVAQLVGVDSNGNEVYEGDIIVNSRGEEWEAELIPAPVSEDGFQHMLSIELFTLKE